MSNNKNKEREEFAERAFIALCWLSFPAIMLTDDSKSGIVRTLGYLATITFLLPLGFVGGLIFLTLFVPYVIYYGLGDTLTDLNQE